MWNIFGKAKHFFKEQDSDEYTAKGKFALRIKWIARQNIDIISMNQNVVRAASRAWNRPEHTWTKNDENKTEMEWNSKQNE